LLNLLIGGREKGEKGEVLWYFGKGSALESGAVTYIREKAKRAGE